MAASRKEGWKCEAGTDLISSMEEEEEDFILSFLSSYAFKQHCINFMGYTKMNIKTFDTFSKAYSGIF
jgi:hypothetical protein